jgi:integrase
MPDNLIKIRKYQGIYYLESKKKRFQGRPDRCFYVTYKNQKKLVREKVGWLSEGYNAQLADQIRANRVSNLRHGKELPNRKKREPTFAEAWKRYDAWLDTGKKHVYDDRNRYKNHLKPKFASKFLSQITPHDLEKFKDSLLKKGLAPQTTKHILVLIRQIYNKMIKWGLWDGQNPIKGVKLPKINNRRVRFLTHQEADELLGAVRKRSQQVWEYSLLSLHTGMRADECFSLLWGHVDFDQGLIHVADPKGGPPRDVYMTEKVREMLQSKEESGKADLVFRATHGGKIPEVSKTVLRTVNDLKLNEGITDRRQKVSFHTLRHTFASWLAIQGTPILEIKELLGHATLAMTERYAHLIPDQKRVSIARMEKAFLQSTNHQEKKDGQSSEPDGSDTKPPKPE